LANEKVYSRTYTEDKIAGGGVAGGPQWVEPERVDAARSKPSRQIRAVIFTEGAGWRGRFETNSKGRRSTKHGRNLLGRGGLVTPDEPCCGGWSGLGEIFMSASRLQSACGGAAFAALALAACTSNTPPLEQSAATAPMTQPAMPSQYRPEEVVGRWGYGAFHNESDLARTSAAARGQCGQPVEITRGANGGVMMYLADSAQLQELQLKGSSGGKNYIGPPGNAGGPQDREIVSFDGRTMVLRWMDPEVAGRYGTGVYVRCAPEGVARAGAKPKPAAQ
jgi:hypothetical protein